MLIQFTTDSRKGRGGGVVEIRTESIIGRRQEGQGKAPTFYLIHTGGEVEITETAYVELGEVLKGSNLSKN